MTPTLEGGAAATVRVKEEEEDDERLAEAGGGSERYREKQVMDKTDGIEPASEAAAHTVTVSSWGKHGRRASRNNSRASCI